MSIHPPPPQIHQTDLVLQPATDLVSLKSLRRKEILFARRLCAFWEEKFKDLCTHWTRHVVCLEVGKDKCIWHYFRGFPSQSLPLLASFSLPCSSTLIHHVTMMHEFHLGASTAEGKRAFTFPGLDVHRQWLLLICLLHWQCVIPAFESP